MMGPINARLSDCVAYGFTGGPEYSTQIVALDNGGELRNADWLYGRHRYSAQFKNLKPAARDEILAAFHVARGRLRCFRFKDWNDYTADDQPLAPEIGSSAPVQLIKTYAWAGEAAVRRCRAIVAAVVHRNGMPVAGNLALTTGLFTPATPWEAGVHRWSGEFDVWVRFDADYNPVTVNNWRQHVATVDLVEDKCQ